LYFFAKVRGVILICKINMSLDFLVDSSILVTGGTGSFGQAFVKTLLMKSGAKRIIVFSRDELKQHEMKITFAEHRDRLRFFIGDVRDLDRLKRAFQGVDYVVHAAALKQVPALEYNPTEAIKTNILGTENVVNAAIEKGVKKVLLISTDKAANPANLYGATKLCAEKLVVNSNFYSGLGGTKLSVVRYGNVFGSRGSIIGVIAKQKASGEITITDEKMTRFWITLDQGIEFVLDSLNDMRGGEIFIPKIPSMGIKDLIQVCAPGCRLKYIGIRPGEKLHESLITPEEARNVREFDNHYIIFPDYQDDKWWDESDNYIRGKEVPEGFFFASHKNDKWLDEEGLKKLLDMLE